LADMKL